VTHLSLPSQPWRRTRTNSQNQVLAFFCTPEDRSTVRFAGLMNQPAWGSVATVLIFESSTLGGRSFNSAIPFELDSGLQPLQLQGSKPLIRRSFSSGLKSRPPYRMAGCQFLSNQDSTDRLALLTSHLVLVIAVARVFRRGDFPCDRQPSSRIGWKASPSRVFRDGEGTSLFKLSHQLVESVTSAISIQQERKITICTQYANRRIAAFWPNSVASSSFKRPEWG
jgi:hypothetical protein